MTTNKKSCLVLGGSFNPPTLAHRKLLNTAMARVIEMTRQETVGVLVPSSHNYVSRKMAKHDQECGHVFPEQMRWDMLELLSEGTGIQISDCELGDDGKGHTYQTLCAIQDQYPDHEICFLVGSDKLKIIPRWGNAEKLLSRFRIIAAAREGTYGAAKRLVETDPVLSGYQDNITLLNRLDSGLGDVSSSDARKYWMSGRYDELAGCCGFRVAAMLWRYQAMGMEYDSYNSYRKWLWCD